MTSHAKTFLTVSRSLAVRTGRDTVRTARAIRSKKLASVRTARAIRSEKFVSRSNSSSNPFKKISIRSNGSSYPFSKIRQPFERFELSVHKNSSAVRMAGTARSKKLSAFGTILSCPVQKIHQPFQLFVGKKTVVCVI